MERRAALLVAGGGFAGALGRHGIAVALPDTVPWGTFLVNVVGAFLLGVFVYRIELRGHISEATRLFVSTGFVSSFTTYSTFATETVSLAPELAALNVVGNYAGGFAAVLLAREVSRWRS